MADASLKDMLDLATRLAAEVGRMALDSVQGYSRGGAVERKADASVVTETDRAMQAHIQKAVMQAFPSHAFLGEETLPQSKEESDIAPSQARYCWVVDPLDGTRNYVSGFPIFGTSIAVLDRGQPVVGVVAEHNLRHLFAAVKGGGVTCNGEAVAVRETETGQDFLVAIPTTKDEISVKVLRNWIATKGFVCRNTGSTAHHLAMVASGALGATFCKRSKIWDIAAGWLLVEEAGGCITDINGRSHTPFDLDAAPNDDLPCLAAAPNTHTRLLESIRAILD